MGLDLMRNVFLRSSALNVFLLALVFIACSSPDAVAPPAGQASNPESGSKPLFNFSWRGRYGYIDDRGRIAITPQFAFAFRFAEGRAVVRVDGCCGNLRRFFCGPDRHSLLNQLSGFGRITKKCVTDLLSTGHLRGEWILIDENGRRLNRQRFDFIEGFSEGLAAANIGGRPAELTWCSGGRWGYIDTGGTLVIPARYEEALPFSEGLAAVRDQGRWKFIDRSGRVALPTPYKIVYRFSEGLCSVAASDYKFGYIDRAGKMVIAPRFVDARSFTEGLALVKIGDLFGFIGHDGKVVIEPRFEWAHPFREGLANVSFGNKIGFIDKTGAFAVPPRFDHALEFSGGLAAVELDEMWGYIDQTGEYAIEPQFACARMFENGLARVGRDKDCYPWNSDYIDREGQYIWKAAR